MTEAVVANRAIRLSSQQSKDTNGICKETNQKLEKENYLHMFWTKLAVFI